LNYDGRSFAIGGNQVGPLAQKFYNAITEIQYGVADDIMGWVETV
jgi:branched-chain amino acid aminotransferase